MLERTYRFTRCETRTPHEVESEAAVPISHRRRTKAHTEHPDDETSTSKTRRLTCRPATVPEISRSNLSIGCGDVSERSRSYFQKQMGTEEGGRRTRGRQRNFELPNDLQPWKPPLLFQFCKVDPCHPCLSTIFSSCSSVSQIGSSE